MIFSRSAATLSVLLALALPGAVAAQQAGDENQLHTDLVLPYLVHLPQHGGKGAPLIVLLHGRGSNEQDLFSLRDALPAQFAVVSVRAPLEMAVDHYQWFEGTTVHGKLDGNVPEQHDSLAHIKRLVDQLVQRYGFDRRKVYLVGFSQGAIMSYEAGLTDPTAFRGIGVMSGAIFDSVMPEIHPSPALSNLQVFVSHGDQDSVIPVQYEREAIDRLRTFGVKPEAHVYPGMNHEINDAALHGLVAWLKRQQ
jgi:phospholipase/carboxylesterase